MTNERPRLVTMRVPAQGSSQLIRMLITRAAVPQRARESTGATASSWKGDLKTEAIQAGSIKSAANAISPRSRKAASRS